MDDQDLTRVEARRKVRDLWDRFVESSRLVENRRQVLELVKRLSDHDASTEKAELEQAERQQACAWLQYCDLNRRVYVST